MPGKSFTQLKTELDDACLLLRSFTLGKPGCTRKDGNTGMERVSKACLKLIEAFGSGLHANSVKTTVAVARGCIEAAKARVRVLNGKK